MKRFAAYILMFCLLSAKTMAMFCNNDPVNKTDPLGLEVYELENAKLFGHIDVPNGYVPYYRGTTAWEDLLSQLGNIGALQANFFYGGVDLLGMGGEKVDDVSIYFTGQNSAELYMNVQAAGPYAAPGAIPYMVSRAGSGLRTGVALFTRGSRSSSVQLNNFARWWNAPRPLGSKTGAIPFGPSGTLSVTKKGETIFRVQGGILPNSSKIRFLLGADGKITIAGEDMLFVNLGQEGRALEFLAKRGDSAELVRFQVTPEFAARLRAEAVSQRVGRLFPGRPQIVDASRAPDQFGIPPNMFDDLLNNIVPGSFQSGRP